MARVTCIIALSAHKISKILGNYNNYPVANLRIYLKKINRIFTNQVRKYKKICIKIKRRTFASPPLGYGLNLLTNNRKD
ncbi:hypothetical protein HR11_10340 [Porphyromonas macacae]|uniref:Uncharacterized protein n=1 Tax=Porphyromonas macacae TaxID=28115 RepID=A0A0A2E7C6_9PORP|nr:hypothetical protein HQ47_07610 [Porphyromonas macacae]KGN96988.1 hypothetical protein HR11_10340 [Porphyromonas macacae]